MLAQAVSDRAAKLYQDGEGEHGCPGEENCQVWISSAEDSPVRCPGCPKRATADGRPATDEGNSDFIDQIERLVQGRNSGFGFPEDLTELEKQLVMVWDETVDQLERSIKMQTLTALATVLGGKG